VAQIGKSLFRKRLQPVSGARRNSRHDASAQRSIHSCAIWNLENLPQEWMPTATQTLAFLEHLFGVRFDDSQR
jgi:hypothetical protein